MKLIFCAVLLACATSLFAQTTPKNTESGILVKTANYSLTCPPSWSVDSSRQMGMDMLLRSARTDSLDLFLENFNVFKQDVHGMNYDISRMGKESGEQIKQIMSGVEILESRLDNPASPQYYILKFKASQGQVVLLIEQHYYIKDEVGYALTLTLQNGNEAKYAAAGQSIFRSFAFNK